MSSSLNAKHLATTNLVELSDTVGLLARVDRKCLVPLGHTQEFVGGLSSEARVLEVNGRRRFSYASTYFDTPGLRAFMLAARKRRRRFKVRTRTYLDSGLCSLEVKTRSARGTTVKRRMGYRPDDTSRLTGSSHTFVAACPASAGVTGLAATRDVTATLRPVPATTYEHTTLHLSRAEARTTIDTALTWQRLTPGGRARATAIAGALQALRLTYLIAATSDDESAAVAGIAVIETKNPATPSPTNRALWDTGHRPARISKYATGMALLRPELPANWWYRTLAHGLAGLFGTNHSNLEGTGATYADASTA